MKEVKLEDNQKFFWIPKKDIKYLTNGFVEVFGEESREFFESIQDQMVQKGYEAGKKYARKIGLGKTDNFPIVLKYSKPDKKDEIVKQLQDLFGKEDVSLIIKGEVENESAGIGFRGAYKFYENLKDYEQKIINHLGTGDRNNVPKLYTKNPKSFKHFKKYVHYSGINMYGDGGFGLDNWSSRDINYALEEGEFFYYIENIARKYYYFGVNLGVQDVKEEWINIGIEKITPETGYDIVSSWKGFLDAVSVETEEEALVNIVRSSYKDKYGEDLSDRLNTRKEISDSIKSIKAEDLPDSLF